MRVLKRARIGALTAVACATSIVTTTLEAQEASPLPDAGQATSTQLPEVVVQSQNKPKTPTRKKTRTTKKKTTSVQAASAMPLNEPTAAPSDGASTPPGATDGYAAKEGIAATKTATPLVEVPQSISTVTRQQLEDRKPQSLNESLGYVPGVRVNMSGFDPRFDNFYIRGFDATYTGVFRDGLRQMTSSFGQFRTEPYGLDSISILRGPVSSLYGGSNAGGIVDMYTKRPTETPFREVEFIAGNHDRFQGNFDFSGPIAPGSDVLYRMTGIVRDSNTEALGVPDDRLYLAPAVTFKIDPDTKITILGEYMDAQTGGNMAWYNDYSSGHAQRTDIWSGDPNFNAFDQTQERIGYEIEHRVNGILTVRQKARYSHLSAVGEYIDVLEEISPDVFTRNNGVIYSKVDSFVIDNQAEARFTAGPFKHVVLAGIDGAFVSSWEGSGYGDPIEDGGIVPPLVNYNYGQQHIPTPPISTVTAQKQFMVGAYLQDQIKLDKWSLTLGGRRDWVDTSTNTDGDVEKQQDGAWTGRAGLSYLFDSGIAPYISYGTGFVPNAGTDLSTGKPLDPTTSESKEVGLKYFIPGMNASITSALFDIQQTKGVIFRNVDVNGVEEYGAVQAGVLRSRGFELEGQASLDNGLSLLFAYSYIDMRIEDNEAGTEGNVQSSVPFNTLSFWGDYTMQSGRAAGLGFGLGVRYIGSSFGNDENTFKNSGHTLFDLAAHYDLGKLDPKFTGARLQMNVNNLFDTRDDVCSFDYCYLDQGRTILGSLRYRW